MLKLMSILDRRMQARTDGDDGATMVEYGLVVTLIAVAAIVALELVGDGVVGHVQRHRRHALTRT